MSQADFNCECIDSTDNETLSQLRTRMMRRLGYSASATNPPPGMSELLDDFLKSSQRTLYLKNSALRTERLYRWTMTPGISYYGIRDNDSDTDFSDIDCGRHLNTSSYRISWVGLQLPQNNMWMPLRCGIDPSYYTTAAQQGLPQLYEIRSCIEVFPVPNAAYKLWIKGMMGIEPFVGDSDQTTIDSELVFLTALGRAKAHYGQKDAQEVAGEAEAFLRDIISGKHLTRRYVPNTFKLPPAVQPVMTQFIPPGS
jgi:hypothetical protein